MSKKDLISKEFFRTPEHFADTCNGILFNGTEVIKPWELSESDTEYRYVSRQDKKSIVDIAKRWNKNNTTISLIVSENQTNTDYAMVLRNMLSESLMYNKQLTDRVKEHRDKKDLITDSECVSDSRKQM